MQRLLSLLLCFLLTPQLNQADLEKTIDELCDRCRQTKSDSVLIAHKGKVLFEYHSNDQEKPVDLLSATSSIASLAIGILEGEGKICLDTPVWQYYPEWNQGIKKQVTIRELLANTSGIHSDFCPKELYHSKSIVQIALCAGTGHIPGASFYYNPKALNLLSGIVQKITGTSLGEYLEIKLFHPLGIKDASWLCDGLGVNFFHSHLSMKASDLAKIGEMLANEGCYRNKQVIPAEWIKKMTQPSQTLNPFFGLQWQLHFYAASCWWDEELINQYLQYGIDRQFVLILQALNGRMIEMPAFAVKMEGCSHFSRQIIDLFGGKENVQKFCCQAAKAHLPLANWKVGSLMYYEADARSGQQLIVIPEKKIVAVRLARNRGCCGTIDPFSDFGSFVGKLAYTME